MTDPPMRLRVLAALSLVGAPLYFIQARRLKRRTPRLPEVPAPRQGRIDGYEPPLRLLAIGESPLAGVGVDRADQTVIAQLAGHLAAESGQAVDWSIVARGGVTVADTNAQLLPKVPETGIDLALIGLGVNDCLQLTSSTRWQVGLQELLDALSGRCRPRLVVLAGVPPMQHFPALPQPLAGMLGLRARLLDRAAAAVASSRNDVLHVAMAFDGRSQDLFCHDGFHPGPRGHERWAEQLVEAIGKRL